MLRTWMCVLVLTAAMACAQEWDVGVIGGFGAAHDLSVKNDSGSATAGFHSGLVLGVYGGEDMYRYWSGEATYLFREGDLKLSSAGTSESFSAHQHLMTGEILAHFKPREQRFRPFVSFGGGLRVLVGTGDEGVFQPLGCSAPGPLCFAALTATHQVQPVFTVGGGVKYKLNNHLRIRVQIRDFLSGQPKDVIAPGPGATLKGIPNDFIGTFSLGYIW